MKHELAGAVEILDMEEKRLFALEEIWRQAVEELKERQSREVPSHEIFMYHSYLQQITLDMEIQRRRVNEVTETFNQRKDALISASQDKRIVEKVREKELHSKAEQFNKEDKKTMNEISTGKYVRDNC